MEHSPEAAPLAAETRTESQQVLLPSNGATGASNSRALKIAGITTLVCLLLSAQAFTAYMVFDQREQINGLQATNQRMEKQMTVRSRVTPQKMVMPIGSLPLVDFFDDGKTTEKAPKAELPKPKNEAPPSVEEQLRAMIKDGDFPELNQSFLTNLQTLKQQVTETEWKSFESWLRYWLIFEKAQKAPTPTPSPEPELVVN